MIRRFPAKTSILVALSLAVGACTGAPAESSAPSAAESAEPSAPAASATSEASAWDEVVAQANEEGEVTLYLAAANYEARILEGFSEAYPDITLTIVREPTGQLVTKLDAEQAADAEGADVAMLSNKRYFDDKSDDLTPLAGPSIDLYEGTPHTFEGNKYFTGFALPYSWASNTEVLEQLGADPIETYDDVLQPELKDRIGLNSAEVTPVALQWFNLVNNEHPGFLTELKALNPRIYTDGAALSQAVASGDLAVGNLTPTGTGALIDAGAPIADVPMRDPEFVVGYYTGIVGWSKHPAAAQVLLNWMLSVEGQTAQHEWGRSASVLPDIEGALEVNTDTLYTGELTPEETAFLEEWKAIFLTE